MPETYLPTPTQAENDQTAGGNLPMKKDYDGSPIDPSSHDPTVPAAPGAPTLTSLAPNTGALPSAPIAVVVHGTNFTATSKITANGNIIPTTFTSATQLSCSMTSAMVSGSPGILQVRVEDYHGFSNTLQFAFTASMTQTARRSSVKQGATNDD